MDKALRCECLFTARKASAYGAAPRRMGALTRTPTPPHRETVGSIESMSASGEMLGSRVVTGLLAGLTYPYLHPFYTSLNPCNVGLRYHVHRDPQIQEHRSIPHDNGFGDHGSTTENSLKISVKWPFMTKIFFACGAPKGTSPMGSSLTAQDRLPHPGRSYPSGSGLVPTGPKVV